VEVIVGAVGERGFFRGSRAKKGPQKRTGTAYPTGGPGPIINRDGPSAASETVSRPKRKQQKEGCKENAGSRRATGSPGHVRSQGHFGGLLCLGKEEKWGSGLFRGI